MAALHAPGFHTRRGRQAGLPPLGTWVLRLVPLLVEWPAGVCHARCGDARALTSLGTWGTVMLVARPGASPLAGVG